MITAFLRRQGFILIDGFLLHDVFCDWLSHMAHVIIGQQKLFLSQFEWFHGALFEVLIISYALLASISGGIVLILQIIQVLGSYFVLICMMDM